MSKIEYVHSIQVKKNFSWQQFVLDSVLASSGALLVTGIIFTLHLYPRIPNISIVYLLVVITLASIRSQYAAILAAVVAFLSFDFFIVPPLYTFVMYHVEEWIALFVFLIDAILTGYLASALRQRAQEASRREQETRILYDIEVLRQMDALRAALLSSVSHDLRTPLASIKAAASSLLQKDVQWNEEARRSFTLSIEHEADRLNRLVGNLLDMSRIEDGALKPEKEWYHIAEVIHDVLSRMRPLLQHHSLQTFIPDDLPPVELDYLQIDAVLTNLIENAIRYTPLESPIEVSVRHEKENIVIGVADRGPGIPPEDRERVFDKFYRILGEQQNTDYPTTGSGLGLAVCKGLVEAHRGRIWTEPREGGGVIFLVALPLSNYERMSV